MNWTTPDQLISELKKQHQKGTWIKALLAPETQASLSFNITHTPKAKELAAQVRHVRAWIDAWQTRFGHRLVYKTVKSPAIGEQRLPDRVNFDSVDEILELLGVKKVVTSFVQRVQTLCAPHPERLAWVLDNTMRAFDLHDELERLNHVVDWLLEHPNPQCYLREVCLPGIDTKWLESMRDPLERLISQCYPHLIQDAQAKGVLGFCRRYGFKDKPATVRMRLLQPGASFIPGANITDITLCLDQAKHLDLPVQTVYIVENEINFLCFPPQRQALVIFGHGFSVSALSSLEWLHDRRLLYWGDLDTNGFAILDSFRRAFPHTESLLMDEATLLAHQAYWGQEPKPFKGQLTHLSRQEQAVFGRLQTHHYGSHVRLEQERLAFDWVEKAIEKALLSFTSSKGT